MKIPYRLVFILGMVISFNANAWFFFWLPLGGTKPSSTSPITSDNNKVTPALSQSSVEPPAKPIFETPFKEASTSNFAQPSESRVVHSTTQFKPHASEVTQSLGARKLIELKGLLDQGLINQKDYDWKKAEILKSM